MRTLFSENILSPSPTPLPQPNPFELLFHSSSNTSSNASTQSSPRQHEWLTQHLQNQQRIESEISNHGSYTSNGQAAQYVRRKGNPKLLFMGLRKYVYDVIEFNMAPCADEPSEAANRLSRRSSSRSSRLPILSSWSRRHALRQLTCNRSSRLRRRRYHLSYLPQRRSLITMPSLATQEQSSGCWTSRMSICPAYLR